MFSGPPLPLPADLPLRFLLGQIQPAEILGAWVRFPTRPHCIRCRTAGRILVSDDLGFLLRWSGRVALRRGKEPVVLETDEVIRWRALQVVTATPYLPDSGHLTHIFPGATLNPAGFHVPLERRPPEEVLADCLTHAIPVSASRIVYSVPEDPARIPPTSHFPVDAMPRPSQR